MRTRCLAVGLLCAALALGWQFLTVRYNYGGNWTGLFCAGDRQKSPAKLLGENLYAFPNSFGYDGQFYHYIAHDPLGRSELPRYVDAPRMRYGRILLPGLAWLLALGQPAWVDRAYYSLVILFIFCGAFCTSAFAARHGRSALWGILFLLTPAALVSIDRMTVDVALLAICAAALALFPLRRPLGEWLLLAAAPLARETGLALTAGYLLWSLLRRDARRVAGGLLSVLPFAAWSFYLNQQLGALGFPWHSFAPFRQLVGVVLEPPAYPWSRWVNALVILTDWLALAGALLAVLLAFRSVRRPRAFLHAAILSFGALGLLLAAAGHRDIWVHLYGYGRVFSPLFLLIALRAVTEQTRIEFVPLLAALPPCGLQFASYALRILRALLSP